MLLAHCNLPRDITIPLEVAKHAIDNNIDVHVKDVPLGANCWIYCPFAWPHDDSYTWPNQYFLTLVVRSGTEGRNGRHHLSDAKAKMKWRCYEGSLFVINPRVTHWLEPENNKQREPWIALQWEVNYREAKQVARDIVKRLDGSWDTLDKRYESWRPL
jgi:hypothetical protein